MKSTFPKPFLHKNIDHAYELKMASAAFGKGITGNIEYATNMISNNILITYIAIL